MHTNIRYKWHREHINGAKLFVWRTMWKSTDCNFDLHEYERSEREKTTVALIYRMVDLIIPLSI